MGEYGPDRRRRLHHWGVGTSQEFRRRQCLNRRPLAPRPGAQSDDETIEKGSEMSVPVAPWFDATDTHRSCSVHLLSVPQAVTQ